MLHNTKLQLRAACLHSLAGGDSVPTVIRLNLDSVGDDFTVVYWSWCKMTVLDDWGVFVFVNLSKQQGESNVMTGLDHSVQTLNMSLNEVLEVDTVILRWIAQYLFISASNVGGFAAFHSILSIFDIFWVGIRWNKCHLWLSNLNFDSPPHTPSYLWSAVQHRAWSSH